MSKTKMIKARAEPDLRHRLEQLAEQHGFTRGDRPNLSEALREAVYIGLDTLENQEAQRERAT